MRTFLSKVKTRLILAQIKPKDQSAIHNTTLVNKETLFEGMNCIEANTNLKSARIGFASYVGFHASVPHTKIGKYTCLANGVQLVLGAHPTHTYVSTHPAFYNPNRPVFSFVTKEPDSFEPFKHQKIEGYDLVIGNDVWIGTDVKIMPGVRIGDGAIVGAGAIVTKDIPPYAIAVGVPAKVIKYRFEAEVIATLQQDPWWEKPFEEIKAKALAFQNVSEYLKGE